MLGPNNKDLLFSPGWVPCLTLEPPIPASETKGPSHSFPSGRHSDEPTAQRRPPALRAPEVSVLNVRLRPIAVTRTKSKLFDNQKWGSALMVFAKSLFCGFWVTIRNIANPSQEKMNVIMNQPNVAPP
jgi:hypothetical protein